MGVTPVDAFGFAAFASNVWGNILLARKSETGWWIRIVSILLWGAYGWAASSLPNLANAVVFLGINIYGLLKWRRERLAS